VEKRKNGAFVGTSWHSRILGKTKKGFQEPAGKKKKAKRQDLKGRKIQRTIIIQRGARN